jgi:hypothetical protein
MPNEFQLLTELLSEVTVNEPSAWNALQVFPLVHPNGHPPTCALVEELLERGEVEVAEISQGGAVPTIKVLNRSGLDALILDGTELRGAKQNRMVNLTIVAGGGTETVVPVSCVEAGRWAYRSRGFAASGRTVGSRLRNLKAHRVAESLARSGVAAADQGEVWQKVDEYLVKGQASSTTQALDDVFARHDDQVESVVARMGTINGHGAMVALRGEIVGLDLFDHGDTFRKAWPALLRGYAIDAILEEHPGWKPLTRLDAEHRLHSLATEAVLAQQAVPGVGEYFTVRGPGVAGGIARHRGRVVHAALFPSVNP